MPKPPQQKGMRIELMAVVMLWHLMLAPPIHIHTRQTNCNRAARGIW